MTSAGRADAQERAGGTLGQRVRVRGLRAISWLARRLPESVSIALADVVGELWFRLAAGRRRQAGRNLQRVVEALDARGQGTPAVRSAARDPRDPRALERLVRRAFRHDARYYLEVLRVPSLRPSIFESRVTIETPEVVEEAFSGGAVIFASAHFGPIELPALYLAHRSGRTFVAPMETVDDPPLQAWFEDTRGSLGVRIVSLRAARRELQAELEAGGFVGIVADRDIAGGGIEVPFFGHPAPFPVGPALLAIQSGARVYAVGVRRMPGGRLAGGLRRVPVAGEGSRRERITATLALLAAAFEEVIAEAPEQWSGAFFEIWPDLSVGDGEGEGADADADVAAGGHANPETGEPAP